MIARALLLALVSAAAAQFAPCAAPDCTTVRCMATPAGFDACKDAKCAAFPNAQCCPGCCSAAVFTLNGRAVDCTPPPPPFQCPKKDCSIVRCARMPTSCAAASCGGHPRAACCETCCGEPNFFDPVTAQPVVCAAAAPPPPPTCPKVDCSNLRCPTPADDPCKGAVCASDEAATCCTGCCGNKTWLSAAGKELTDCEPVTACRCQADDVTKVACEARFGAGKFTTFRDQPCNCLQCKPLATDCTTVRCASPESVKTNCINGTVVMGACCPECKPTTISCRCQADDVTKAACETRFGAGKFTTFRDQPCNCLQCKPLATNCTTVRCASPESVKTNCIDGTVVMGDCCFECKPTVNDKCATVRCASPESVKTNCIDGTVVMGECCFECKPKVSDKCATVRCASPESVKANCVGGTVVMGECCSECRSNDPCKQAIVPGPGRALQPAFGFDGMSCVKFTYGGVPVEGNTNRFGSEEECQKRCGNGGGQIGMTPVINDDAGNGAASAVAVGAAVVVACAAANL